MRLLLVEDEHRLSETLGQNLHREGFSVDRVGNAAEAELALKSVQYDTVILDLGLPDCDGLVLLSRLRQQGLHTPVLILTARDAVEDRVAGLDRGADDYLVKPFATTELISRVKALLRRPGGVLGSVLSAGNVSLDTVGRDVMVNGKTLELPRRETAVLEHLLRRLGRVVPRDLLEDKLYGFGEEIESNAVPVHIHHLRKKLEQAGGSVEIHTVRGVGYLLEGKTP